MFDFGIKPVGVVGAAAIAAAGDLERNRSDALVLRTKVLHADQCAEFDALSVEFDFPSYCGMGSDAGNFGVRMKLAGA